MWACWSRARILGSSPSARETFKATRRRPRFISCQEDSRKRPPAKLDHQPEAAQLVANARPGRAGYRTVLLATAVAVDSRRIGQLFPGAVAPAPAGSQTRAGTKRSRRHRRERLVQQGRADGKGILRPELLRRGRLVVEPEPTRHRSRAMGR